ncbi:MAG: hypothetical protein E6554_16790 [Bacteroides sp.]|nr:hypothetical protein [Bacteroides sp.]SAC05708.1 Uncharacterised protein [Enterobacter hormaechei]SAE59221.1 Uncharacterised protein [Enterobacter hormaechei]VAG07777.1 Uncharacterised protein [Enterobacter hormaechei]
MKPIKPMAHIKQTDTEIVLLLLLHVQLAPMMWWLVNVAVLILA